ncbi:c-type cytochrome biogenesis protein CcmI [Palleronia abyssalis]|uniref:Cytochrome c-type biogenesis protein H TPR domain-containing protein n=1 Tax=Palleronia abyssalis TaxID=1501240 RepID=A0A2R8BQL6_9RHOB|nr:c-type cytochrome biogenesis protein CcmI [Palleronia abyssalis]SPJ22474.1 hypothetical protein PAA8504_00268 [Palleronia abyssalis]
MLFWIAAIVIAALGALPIIGAVLRGAGDASGRTDMAIYRDQLAEVERDLARGTLTEAEAEQTRAEVARRLLDADRRQAPTTALAPRTARIVAAATVALAVMAGGVALYITQGAPGYPDLPLRTRLAQAEDQRANRPNQAQAEAEALSSLPEPLTPEPEFAALLDRLRRTMEERPDDSEGWTLLARNEARIGDFRAAARAQERAVALLGEDAASADIALLGEFMVLAAGGFVSPQAESRFDAALARDPNNGRALYFKGLTLAQTGRPDRAFGIWRALLEATPGDAPWNGPIRAQIGQVAARAGIDYVPPGPDAAPGPTAEDMENAAGMTPEAREEMIRGMVEGLSQRLATEGGPAPDWARLISALGVLGQTDRAAAIADEARQVFANQPDDVALIEDAAAAASAE